MAEKNAAMAIWLGKQYLGQRDVQEIVTTDIDRSIAEMDDFFDERKKKKRS